VAVKFLRGELKEEVIPSPAAAAKGSPTADLPIEFSVDVDGEVFNVKVSSVLGKTIEVDKTKQPKEIPPGAVVSPLQGMILAVKVKVGDKVKEGDMLMTIEAMKMQNQVTASCSGVVREILTFQGEIVNAGDILMVVEANGESVQKKGVN
jgi:pyruvate carboxylase subunit B